MKWAIYTRKKVEKRKQKDDLIQKAVKAIDVYYTNLLTKSFVSLGLRAIKQRRIRKNYETIKGSVDKKLKKNYFEKYRKRYQTQVI